MKERTIVMTLYTPLHELTFFLFELYKFRIYFEFLINLSHSKANGDEALSLLTSSLFHFPQNQKSPIVLFLHLYGEISSN